MDTIYNHDCREASWEIAQKSTSDITFELRCTVCGYVFSRLHHRYLGDPAQDDDLDTLVGIPLKMRRGDETSYDLPMPNSPKTLADWWNGPQWESTEHIRQLRRDAGWK
jgi:hypothetical protein